MTDSNLNRCFLYPIVQAIEQPDFIQDVLDISSHATVFHCFEKQKVKEVKTESETCLKLEGMAEDGVL